MVRILDLQGRELIRQNAKRSVPIDVKMLTSGLYHVVVSDGMLVDIKQFRK